MIVVERPHVDKPDRLFRDDVPNLVEQLFDVPTYARLEPAERMTHPPRFMILYGSLRARSYSRFLAHEAARLLERMGGEVRIYDARGLPLPDDTPLDHPKVQELR